MICKIEVHSSWQHGFLVTWLLYVEAKDDELWMLP